MIDPELARQAVRLAMERGATDAECTLAEGQEFSAQVRMRELETLKDAGSRRVGLRVLVGKRVGSAHTSDLSSDGVRQMVESALAIAAISTEDPYADLPDASELGSLDGDLELYSDDIHGIDTPGAHSSGARNRRGRAFLGPAHHKFRRRFVQRIFRPARVRQLARIFWAAIEPAVAR